MQRIMKGTAIATVLAGGAMLMSRASAGPAAAALWATIGGTMVLVGAAAVTVVGGPVAGGAVLLEGMGHVATGISVVAALPSA
jgi:hypothetical protein